MEEEEEERSPWCSSFTVPRRAAGADTESVQGSHKSLLWHWQGASRVSQVKRPHYTLFDEMCAAVCAVCGGSCQPRSEKAERDDLSCLGDSTPCPWKGTSQAQATKTKRLLTLTPLSRRGHATHIPMPHSKGKGEQDRRSGTSGRGSHVCGVRRVLIPIRVCGVQDGVRPPYLQPQSNSNAVTRRGRRGAWWFCLPVVFPPLSATPPEITKPRKKRHRRTHCAGAVEEDRTRVPRGRGGGNGERASQAGRRLPAQPASLPLPVAVRSCCILLAPHTSGNTLETASEAACEPTHTHAPEAGFQARSSPLLLRHG